MKIIPAEQYPQRDQQALFDFLTQCQQMAVQRGRPVLASITLKVRHIDPLGVLQSIYEQDHLHFYLENSQMDEAIAGAEAVVSATFQGPDRFAATQAFIRETLDAAVAIGDMDVPFSGPHFFCAFTFAPKTEGEGGGHFAPATVFVPRWQVASHSEGYTAVANIWVAAQTDLQQETVRVLAAHSKFLRFDYAQSAGKNTPEPATMAGGGASAGSESTAHNEPPTGEPVIAGEPVAANDSATASDSNAAGEPEVAEQSEVVGESKAAREPTADGTAPVEGLREQEVGGQGYYLGAVAEGLRRIASGKYEKIVLARMLDLHSPVPLHPLEALNRLRERYPSCYAFSFANGRGQSFIGSSPERLLRVQGRRVLTEALAGSAPRSASAGEDARLGSELLHNDKDLREHELVRATIVADLQALGVQLDAASVAPRLRKLPNLQHLWTPLVGTLAQGCDLLTVAERLHPTPAVGGVPRAVACEDVPELEAAPRGLYTGALGWVDARGNGEMVVALRSGLIDGCNARLYAGAGIVEGSDPQLEQRETELKFRPLLNSLRAVSRSQVT